MYHEVKTNLSILPRAIGNIDSRFFVVMVGSPKTMTKKNPYYFLKALSRDIVRSGYRPTFTKMLVR